MEIKNQIRNYECEKCKVKPQAGVLIMNWCGYWLCGRCCGKAMAKEKAEKKRFLIEG